MLASVVPAADGPSRVTVETVTGESLEKSGLKSIDGGTATFADGSSLPVDDLRSIRFAESIPVPKGEATSVVHLSGSGRLPVRDAVLVDDACEATLLDGRKTTLSLIEVAAIQWSESSDPAWADSLSKPSEEHDFVVLKAQPQATAVRAFVEAIAPESIEFDWDKQTRTLQRDQVIGIVFARPEKPSPVYVRVQTIVGAVLPVTKLEPAAVAKQLRCTLARGTEIEIPSTDVASIQIQSTRMKWLSELTPARVIERPIAAFPRGWKADLNVRGETLKAGSQIFGRGLGVQSGTSLSYDLDGTAEQFAAVLAIDSPDGVAGDCEFVVIADDKELDRRHVKTGDEPASVRVPLKGAKRLELRVDYGSNLDFGDHANWCDAHLVVQRPAVVSL
jgi:hypothetical protein